MFMYSSLEVLAAPSQAPLATSKDESKTMSSASKGPLSFVVDLGELGLRDAYRAHEIHRGSQCTIFARVGPEYVNPWSGESEQANWIL